MLLTSAQEDSERPKRGVSDFDYYGEYDTGGETAKDRNRDVLLKAYIRQEDVPVSLRIADIQEYHHSSEHLRSRFLSVIYGRTNDRFLLDIVNDTDPLGYRFNSYYSVTSYCLVR